MHNTVIVMVLLVLIILASVDVMRRAVLQVIQTQRQRRIQASVRRLRRPVQPWVTVIVYGNSIDEEREATLRSLQRSRYYSYDVVFVGPRARTYQTAYRKSKRGKIVIYLQAGCVVDPSLIKRAVALSQNKREWRVSVLLKPAKITGFMGIIHQLQHVLWGRPIVVGACSAAALRQKKIPARRARPPRLIPAAMQIIMGVIIITAVTYEGLSALWYGWLIVSSYLLLLIWLHYEMNRAQRWKLSFAAPSALFLLPVSSIIEGSLQLYARK